MSRRQFLLSVQIFLKLLLLLSLFLFLDIVTYCHLLNNKTHPQALLLPQLPFSATDEYLKHYYYLNLDSSEKGGFSILFVQ